MGALVALGLAGCAGETGGGETGPQGTATGASFACSVPAACPAVERECLGLVDNSGKTRFGLRVSEVHLSAPRDFGEGLMGRALATDVLPSNLPCNLNGSGATSFLLRFDTEEGSLEIGGARPVVDPMRGYAFVDEPVLGQSIHPVKFAVDIADDGSFVTSAAHDLLLPMFLDTYGKVLVFPIRAARLSAGALSPSRGCIGRYDAAALEPSNACLPDVDARAFVAGATLEGLLVLDDADRVVVDRFGMSLCARLAGASPALVTKNAAGITVCRRDSGGRIVFQGDACSASGESCGDAVAVRADFAASSVRIEE
jgi:hypothetical protein